MAAGVMPHEADHRPPLWLVTITIMSGTIAAVMGASTVNVALPDIMAGLGISQDQVSWVSTGYMLANVIAIPTTAWLGDLLGKRTLFAFGLMVFLVGSILCGMSWDFSSMIGFRILQGLAAGLLLPTAQSLMFEAFPANQRGLAMGVYGMGAIMGPALGPTVGGYLVNALNWRAIFYVNIPFAIVSLMLITLLPTGARKGKLSFDTRGFAALVVTLSCLQIALSNGAKDGWGQPYIVGCFAVTVLAGIYLILHELTVDKPLIDLDVFRFPAYNAVTGVSFIIGFGLYGSTFLVPLFLGEILGYSALDTGLVMLPGSLVMGVMMLFAGRLADLIDIRLLICVGLAIFGYFLYLDSIATLDSTRGFFAWALVWRGVGMALASTPLTAAAMNGVPPRLISQAAGTYNLLRQLAGSIGIALMNTLLTARAAVHRDEIGELMSPHNPAVQRFLAQARLMFVTHGYAPDRAGLAASVLLGKQASMQIAVLSFADLFYISMVVSLAGLLPALLLKARRETG